jgi:hypothetical protein
MKQLLILIAATLSILYVAIMSHIAFMQYEFWWIIEFLLAFLIGILLGLIFIKLLDL